MEYIKDLYFLAFGAIGKDIGVFDQDQLTGAVYSARTPQLRKLQKLIYADYGITEKFLGGLGIILGDVIVSCIKPFVALVNHLTRILLHDLSKLSVAHEIPRNSFFDRLLNFFDLPGFYF